MDDISDYIKAACHEKGRGARVEEHKLSALPVEKGMARARMLADNGMGPPTASDNVRGK